MASLQELIRLLGEVQITDRDDAWRWMIGSSGDYSVAETRQKIDASVLPSTTVSTRWSMVVPKKVNVFIWRLNLSRLPTRLALSRKGLEIVTLRCAVCEGSTESVEYLFCECPVAVSLWELVFRWFHIPSVIFAGPREVFAWVDTYQQSAARKKIIEAVVYATLWFVWRYRNDVVHETRVLRKNLLFDSIREFSFLWFSNRNRALRINWTVWFQNPLNVL